PTSSLTPAEDEDCANLMRKAAALDSMPSRPAGALSHHSPSHQAMPRIEPDDDREHESWLFRGRWRSGWRRRLLTWALVAAGLGLGFLIPYTLYLDHQVTERFGQLRWQLPTRVYARPLLLAPGVAMDAKTLATELAAASYRDDGAGVRPGTYG